MQKTLEVLKNGDGIIVKKLSYKKLYISYSIPLVSDNGEVLGIQNMSSRFKRIEETNVFECLIKPKFWQVLSMKWGVKMKNISHRYNKDDNISGYVKPEYSITLDFPFVDIMTDIKLNYFIKELVVTDKSWVRNYKLKQILDGQDI